MRHKRVEDVSGQPARAAHALEPLRSVELDDMASRFGAIFGADMDIFSHLPKIGKWRANVEWRE
jgi:hypothetical protein